MNGSSPIEITKELYLKLNFLIGSPILYLQDGVQKSSILTLDILKDCTYTKHLQSKRTINYLTIYLKDFNSLSDIEFNLLLDKISKRFTFESLEDLSKKISEDSEMFCYLLSIGFDIFNLISLGLARSRSCQEYKELVESKIK